MKEDGTISKNKDLPGIFYLYLSYLFSSILASSKTQKNKPFSLSEESNTKNASKGVCIIDLFIRIGTNHCIVD